MKKHIAIVVVLAVLVAFAWLGSSFWKPVVAPVQSEVPEFSATLEEFFNRNLGALSPVKPSLGGSFYVTKVEARDGVGTVSYEDGHNAYVADFGYSIDAQGVGRVETFSVRK